MPSITSAKTSEGSAGATVGRKKRLIVARFQKKRARTTEAAVEKKLAAYLGKAGIISWHMSCREGGWPDRYLVGGRWIEVKSLAYLGAENGLDPGQIIKLDELSQAGEKCFYFAKVEDHVIFMRWGDFKDAGMLPLNCPRYAYADLCEAIRYVL